MIGFSAFRALVLAFVFIGCGSQSSAPPTAPTKTGSAQQTPGAPRPQLRRLSPRPNVAPIECKRERAVPREAEEQTKACVGGDLFSCLALVVEGRAPDASRTTARTAIENGCKNGSACACSMHGRALVADPWKRFDDPALGLLAKACGEGVLDACDEVARLARLCSNPHEGRPLCEKLRQRELVPDYPNPSEPQLELRPLPEHLADCFVVSRDLGEEKCEVEGAVASTKSGPEGVCPSDLAGCKTRYALKHVWICPELLPEAGSTYCLAPDEVRFRAASSQSWTRWAGHWSARAGEEVFYGPRGIVVRLDGRELLLGERFRMSRVEELKK